MTSVAMEFESFRQNSRLNLRGIYLKNARIRVWSSLAFTFSETTNLIETRKILPHFFFLRVSFLFRGYFDQPRIL